MYKNESSDVLAQSAFDTYTAVYIVAYLLYKEETHDGQRLTKVGLAYAKGQMHFGYQEFELLISRLL